MEYVLVCLLISFIISDMVGLRFVIGIHFLNFFKTEKPYLREKQKEYWMAYFVGPGRVGGS